VPTKRGGKNAGCPWREHEEPPQRAGDTEVGAESERERKMERMLAMRTTAMTQPLQNSMRLLAIVLLALAVLAVSAPAAGAAGKGRPWECRVSLENGVVNGDLIVPAGATCELRGTIVRGDVRLSGGGDEYANLRAEGVRITGDLRIGEQSIAYFDDTRVGGNAELRGTWAVLDAFGGSIGGWVRLADAERINLLGTAVGGDVRFERSRLIIADEARIQGNFRATDVEFAAVIESRVSGNVAIDLARDEARLCGSRLGGNAVFDNNAGTVAIGAGAPRCDGNTVEGHVRVRQNTGGVTISDNIVRNNLTCRDNEPAPTGGNNRVGGQKQGQCGGI
jgi:hypothetical protein